MRKSNKIIQIKECNNEHGITLIALVITIIILLILAGITLNLALGDDGIIRKAIDVSKKYEETEKDELKTLNEFENQLLGILSGEGNIPEKIVNISLNKEKMTLDREDKETLIATIIPEEEIDIGIKWISRNEDIAEVSQSGEVTAKTVGETVIEAILQDGSNKSATCEVTVTNPTVAKKAELGAYIKYEVPEKEFTMKSEQTGQDTDQNFNTSTYTGLWRVLYNDEEHGLQIISDDIVGNLTLGHADSDGDAYIRNEEDERKVKIAYNNLVSTLNTFSRYYINERYATSGRSVGSNPITPDDNETKTEKLIPSDYPRGSGNYDSGCLLVNDFEKTTRYDYSSLSRLGISNENGNSYWFAARIGYSNSDNAHFGAYWGGGGYYLNDTMFWRVCDEIHGDIVSSVPFGAMHGVRPVITLKPNIKTESGNGKKDTPFTLIEM